MRGKRVAVLTGRYGGLGKYIYKALKGFTVITLGNNSKNDHVIDLSFYNCDGYIVTAMQNIVAEYGRIDALINNAGITNIQYNEDELTKTFDLVMNVNVRAPFILMREFLRLEKDSKDPRIVINIASMASFYALRCSTAYNASKAALVAMTKQFAREEANRYPQFRFHCISPCGLRENEKHTGGMIEKIIPQMVAVRGFKDEETARKYNLMSPSGKLEDFKNVAKVVRFLIDHGTINMSGCNWDFRDCGP